MRKIAKVVDTNTILVNKKKNLSCKKKKGIKEYKRIILL
jgi:hypothetical protein